MEKPVYLVAGASSGMGRMTARQLGKSDSHVICAARRLDACEELAEAIKVQGGSAQAMQFDGTDAASVAAMVDAIVDQHGKLDGAFNNLGDTIGSAPLHEIPADQWDTALAVNLSSVFHLMHAQIPLMLRAGKGRIVNNSSTAGLKGIASMSDYSAAKWGVIGLTKSAALDYAGQGLIFNAIAPGIIATEKFEVLKANMPEIFEKLREETPAGRFGDMQEIAELVDWLLRSAPGYINGQVLPIDGGRTA